MWWAEVEQIEWIAGAVEIKLLGQNNSWVLNAVDGRVFLPFFFHLKAATNINWASINFVIRQKVGRALHTFVKVRYVFLYCFFIKCKIARNPVIIKSLKVYDEEIFNVNKDYHLHELLEKSIHKIFSINL